MNPYAPRALSGWLLALAVSSLAPSPVAAQSGRAALVVASEVRAASMPDACTPYVFGGHAYYFCHVDRDFAGAASFCRAFNAEPASLASRFENDLVAGVVQTLGRGRHWIGYTDAEREGIFTAVDGSPATFSAWAVDEPNDAGGEDCVELDGGGFWNDVPCATPRANVVCEESSACTVEVFHDHLYRFCQGAVDGPSARARCDREGASVAHLDDDAECAFVAEHSAMLADRPLVTLPRGATCPSVRAAARGVRSGAYVCEAPAPCVTRYFDHHAYRFCLEPGATARSAARSCQAMGGTLATLESAAEDAFVYASFGVFRRARFYIGLTDEGSEGSFHTLAGRPMLYSRWIAGEPNNNLGSEHCVELAEQGWNDIPCEGDSKGAYVCEMP